MIQAVADDDERGELGMHYTSVPNIQKVLDPLFLDDLREQLEAAGTNKRKLFNLRQRLSRIRVFDPACGSGNFLVIAYIRLREIEDEIMRRRGEALERSAISLTQFYGIEIKSFAAEIARLSLLIAEFQCDVRFIGQMEARALVLPLHATGTIVTGNALRIAWEEVCPPVTPSAEEQDLGGPTGRLNLEGGGEDWETYICGNPPFAGLTKQTPENKSDLRHVYAGSPISPSAVDYVSAWYYKSAAYAKAVQSQFAFVSTNSICQGQSVTKFWSHILEDGVTIRFAHTSFLWKNLAKKNAGVIVVVVGLDRENHQQKWLYTADQKISCDFINPYLTSIRLTAVRESNRPLHGLSELVRGSIPNCDGNLVLDQSERNTMQRQDPSSERFLHRYVGAQEISKGIVRYCLFIPEELKDEARDNPAIADRIEEVRRHRLRSTKKTTREVLSKIPHRFELISSIGGSSAVAVSRTTSENREFLAADIFPEGTVVNDNAFFAEPQDLVLFSILVSRSHLRWIATVCGRMKNDYRYANTLGWNTFPVPKLTETDRANLTRCAEDILLAREAHFPATIAELYDPEKMPDDLRTAHDRNDETLERIYIGRCFRNDTERLEKLFDMYTKMTAKKEKA